ncbi:MAG: exodeoxyribonuclease III [Arsenophonus sp.]|nr:MAG: exodeoxyribonuclease III [Arsenophonus sp.]
MKIVSFNINGIRAHIHQLYEIINKYNPDIIGLQETKVHDLLFPCDKINNLGYGCTYYGQKSHYGVALLYKKKPLKIYKGLPNDQKNVQPRVISAIFKIETGSMITIINSYFPNGENKKHPIKFPAKKKFFKDFISYLKSIFFYKSKIVIIGDMNISPSDLDIGIGLANMIRWLKIGKCAFLPEERNWIQLIQDIGFIDVYRKKNPKIKDKFSWFDYRSNGFKFNRGLRIDLILSSLEVFKKCSQIDIDYEIRSMHKPSDHAPVWADFDYVIL